MFMTSNVCPRNNWDVEEEQPSLQRHQLNLKPLQWNSMIKKYRNVDDVPILCERQLPFPVVHFSL